MNCETIAEQIARLRRERDQARLLAEVWRSRREFGQPRERLPWEPAETYTCPGCGGHIGLFGPVWCPLCGEPKPVTKAMVRP